MTHRDMKILQAVTAGKVWMTRDHQPELEIDGRYCCDQTAGPRLVKAGLICPITTGLVTRWVPAVLTVAGRAVLNELGVKK